MSGKWFRPVIKEGTDQPRSFQNPQNPPSKHENHHKHKAHIINTRNDNRPFIEVLIFNQIYIALLDSGASITVMQMCKHIEERLDRLEPTNIALRTANEDHLNVLGKMTLQITFGNKKVSVETVVVDELAQDLILGINFWKAAGIRILDEENNEVMAVKSHPISNIVPEIEIPRDDQESLRNALEQFTYAREDKHGTTNVLEHKIELIDDAQPFLQRSHLFSPALQEKINVELNEMLEKGIVSPSKSPVASPIVPVVKPNGDIRICLDSRKLNSITKKDQFPVPNVNHIFARMPKAKYFSTIDLSKAFWQVPLSKKRTTNQFANSRELTAFIVPGRGLFEFNVMPFGLVNSAATQCRLMHYVIGHDLEPSCFVYVDDIILMTESIKEMIKVLAEVGRRLTRANLSINAKKFRLFANKVKYLGYIVSENGMEIDPERVKVMVEYPQPKTIKSLRRFLGLTGYYRRLIKNFSGIASPLTNLLRNETGNHLNWCEGAKVAFEILKRAMCEAPVVRNPDFSLEFHVQCDASNTAGAAALGQHIDDIEVVIAFYSHKWNKTEVNWSATEKEAATVLYAIRHFKSYLWGRHFTIITDAQALTHVKSIKTDGSSKLAHWALELNSHNVTIKHRSGRQSMVPDALSRAIDVIIESEETNEDAWYRQMMEKVTNDPEAYTDFQIRGQRLFKYEATTNDIGCFQFIWKEYVPEHHRIEVITNTHKTLCHLGWEKCAEMIKRRYFWPKMKPVIEKTVRRCDTCKATKASNHNIRVPMGLSRNAENPFQMIAIDHWGPTQRSRKGNTCMLIVVDIFSKMVLLHAKRDTSSIAVVRFLEDEVFLKYGTPQTLISDNHKPLVGRNMIALMTKYNVNHWTIPAYHSQANPAERYLRTVGAAIRAQIMENNANHQTWDEQIPMIQRALNTTINETTRKSPFFVNFGREMILDGQEYEFTENNTSRSNLSVEQLRQRFEQVREQVKVQMQRAQQKFTREYNKKTQAVKFETGERAWRKNRELSNALHHFSQRLAPKYVPCKVMNIVGNDTYMVQDEGKETQLRVHANDLLKDYQ